MKKFCLIVALMLFFVAVLPAQASILPNSQELFGAYMPCLGVVIGKEAVRDEILGDCRVLTYSPFTDANYSSFGCYMNGWGFTVKNYEYKESTVTITLVRENVTILFSYDIDGKCASVTYPKGTRPEPEKSVKSDANSIFPALRDVYGRMMPSLSEVIGKKADKSSGRSELLQQYSGVTEEQFDAFNAYVAQMGCILSKKSVSGSTATVKYENGNDTMTIVYNYVDLSANVTYSKDVKCSDAVGVRTDVTGAPVTAEELFGVFVPSASIALERKEYEISRKNNEITYVYHDFSDKDYETFGKYMEEDGCNVVSYSNEDGILVILMEKKGHTFSFIYERDNHIGKVIYPKGTRAERE